MSNKNGNLSKFEARKRSEHSLDIKNANGLRYTPKAARYNKGENYELFMKAFSLSSLTYYHYIICKSRVFCKFFCKNLKNEVFT